MRKIAIAALFLIIGSPAFGQTVLDGSFPIDGIASLEQMHASVTAEFTDPRSAQYKGMIVRNKAYKPAICGLVNARNSLGGYTPFYPFAYSIEDARAYVATGYKDEIVGGLVVSTLEMMGCPLSSLGL